MIPSTSAIVLCLCLAIAVLGGRPCYNLHLRCFTAFILRKNGYSLTDLRFSFEEITYVVSFSSLNQSIREAREENFFVEMEYVSFLYPDITGIKIIHRQPDGTEQLIAHMDNRHFRLPLLDKLLLEGKVNEGAYRKICNRKLIDDDTLEEIRQEVIAQIRKNRFSQA